MVQYFATQIQGPDVIGEMGRLQQIQNMRERNRLQNLRMQQMQQESALAQQQQLQQQAQQQQLQDLSYGAVRGDRGAWLELMSRNPQQATALSKAMSTEQQAQQQQQTQLVQYGAQLAQGVLNVPANLRSLVYQNNLQKFAQAGGDVSNLPTNYSPEIDPLLENIVNQARDIEKVREEPFKERELALKERGVKITETDMDLRAKQFAQDLKKFDAQYTDGNLTQEESFKRAEKLRGEFRKLSGDYIQQRDAFGRIQASAEDPSPAGDLALIFNYMKVLDPGSTVREGEFANAENSGSIPDRIRAMYNKTLEGKRLSPKMRQDFVSRANKIFKASEAQHQQRIGQYTDLSIKSGVPADQVILDLGLAAQQSASIDAPTPEDIKFTAEKYNISEDEVRRRLGL